MTTDTRPAFTPGPWLNVEPDSQSPSRARVCAALGAAIYDAPLTRETEGNARLIAAAPELYEALRDLHGSIEHAVRNGADCPSCGDIDGAHSTTCAAARARAALAKADGR